MISESHSFLHGTIFPPAELSAPVVPSTTFYEAPAVMDIEDDLQENEMALHGADLEGFLTDVLRNLSADHENPDEFYSFATGPDPYMDLRTADARLGESRLSAIDVEETVSEIVHQYNPSPLVTRDIDSLLDRPQRTLSGAGLEMDAAADAGIASVIGSFAMSDDVYSQLVEEATGAMWKGHAASEEGLADQPKDTDDSMFRDCTPEPPHSMVISSAPPAPQSDRRRSLGLGEPVMKPEPDDDHRVPVAAPRFAAPAEDVSVDHIAPPDAAAWHCEHPKDEQFLLDLVAHSFPVEALLLDQVSFDKYDVKYNIRKGILKSKAERAALTKVRRKLMGRERSRMNRRRAKENRMKRKQRWKKARVTLHLLAMSRQINMQK